MKPLIAIVTFNRLSETRRTLRSLIERGACEEAEILIFDNDSKDGASDLIFKMIDKGKLGTNAQAIFSPANVGCPRALNRIMEDHRKPGQALIKLDNDVIFHTDGWVGKLIELAESVSGLALLSAYYHEVFEGRACRDRGDWYEAFPLVGHCVYHAGWFLDEVGYFDILAPDHFYGFEDLLMCHRAVRRGYSCGVAKYVFAEMIQRHNSLDVAAKAGQEAEGREAHVARLRALYNERVWLIASLGGGYYVNESGQIAGKKKHEGR